MSITIAHPQKRIELISPPKKSAGGGSLFWGTSFKDNLNPFSAGVLDSTAGCVRTGLYALKVTSAGASTWETTASTTVISNSPQMFNSKMAIEGYVRLQDIDNTALNHVQLSLVVSDGTTQRSIGVRIVLGAAAANAKLQYVNSAGAYADVTSGGFTAAANHYYRIKIVVDMISNEYVKLEFGGKIWSLSGIAISESATLDHNSNLIFEVDGIDATTKSAWLDDLSVTYNES